MVVGASVGGGAAVVGASVGGGAVVAVVGGSVVEVVVVLVVTATVVRAAVVSGASVVGGEASVAPVVPRPRSLPSESLEHDTISTAAHKPTHSDLHRIRTPPLSVDVTLTLY